MEKKSKLKKVLKFIKKYAFLIIIFAVVITVLITGKKNGFENIVTVDVVRTDVIKEVNVTGRVEPTEKADLKFEVPGRIEELLVDVGDRVKKGDALIKLNDDELQAQLKEAAATLQSAQAEAGRYRAGVDVEKAQLGEIRRGAREEELSIAATEVANANLSLQDNEESLDAIRIKAEIDLSDAIQTARTSLSEAATSAKEVLIDASDVQTTVFTSAGQFGQPIEQAKAKAVYTMLGEAQAYRWSGQFISKLNGGAFAEAKALTASSSIEEVESVLESMLASLGDIKKFIDTMPLDRNMTDDQKTTISNARTTINGEITTLTARQKAIDVQKSTNESLIKDAEVSITSAQNALELAREQQRLTRAGSTQEEIATQEAQVRVAQANLNTQYAQIKRAQASIESIQTQIDKTILRSPIDGIITMRDAEPGEIIDVNTLLVSIISDDNFEIESDVPEVEIAKISINDVSNITLDAYGDEEIFTAIVKKIDPGATIIDGVTHYRTTFQFLKQDPRILSGMTANIQVVTDRVDNVLALPDRAIIKRDGKTYVKEIIVTGDKKELGEMEVLTGMKGSDGFIEIKRGLNEGDEIVINGQ